GRLQVELAALTYQRSRLVRSWTHLERQRGGHGFMGGPGETQIEVDRRMIDQRIVRLKQELEQVMRTRRLHRKKRRQVPYRIVALVGYTNAGKSTLFNRLTESHVDARDQLFATLDPTLRGLRLPSGRRVILSDTVGFVSELPTMLVAAFRATLEEVLEADVILHVRDLSHPDTDAQREDVHGVLAELGLEHEVAEGLPEALNKIDLLDPAARDAAPAGAATNPNQVAVSALTGEGMDRLLSLLEGRLARTQDVLEVALPHDDGRPLAWLHAHGEVLARHDDRDKAYLTVRLNPADRARFERNFDIPLSPSWFGTSGEPQVVTGQ
ncbi:MAG: GTPase HflX, partial [Acetobacterales bacterium]